LIEADTDGVYFATTPHWGEAEQRALVAEVASELPHGIRLEYEGRYAAMLSHEVKNYALLRYDGTLIVRGVALKSSRAEPFGERFLNEILPCALRGDIAAVRRIFVETVLALRARQLPTADVAIRARLSKTPANYRVAGQREGQYEALLNAGRTHWERGERVRYYRRSDNSYALLPELVQDAEPARDYHAEHYVGVLVNSYASRLKKAFTPADFDQLFRSDMQLGLFDQPLEAIQPIRIRAPH
jgi:DNA polymerase elongation subunit (family B)